MKTIARLWIATAATLTAVSLAHAQPATPEDCAQKRASVQTEIDQAKAAGQQDRVKGLERALAEIKVSCTEPGLKAKRERRINQQEKEVTQRQLALDKAESEGKADKIARRKAKLKEAQDELAKLQKQ